MQEFIEKAEVLIEALPYIQSFRDKIVVIKYGGSAITATGMDSVLVDVVFMEIVGMRPVIVHGGGRLISQRMQEAGIVSQFVNGLRVTDERTMEIVEGVLFGEVNGEIVEAIQKAGGRAYGLSAKAAGILKVRKHLAPVQETSGTEWVDIGYVGDVEQVDSSLISALCQTDAIPVIAPIGLGPDGKSYNINADTAAGEIAAALGAEKLVFLTDVQGILADPSDEGSLISTVWVDDVNSLIASKIVDKGMIPKVKAGVRAVRSGVHKTHIIDGRIPHSLLLEIFTNQGIGTQIIP